MRLLDKVEQLPLVEPLVALIRPHRLGASLVLATSLALGVAACSKVDPRDCPEGSLTEHNQLTPELDRLLVEVQSDVSQRNSGEYMQPTADQFTDFADARQLLIGGDIQAASKSFEKLGCEVFEVDEFIVLKEKDEGKKGWPTLIINPNAKNSNLTIALDRPKQMKHGIDFAYHVAQEAGAKYLLISGHHPEAVSKGDREFSISDPLKNRSLFSDTLNDLEGRQDGVSILFRGYGVEGHGELGGVDIVVTDGSKEDVSYLERVAKKALRDNFRVKICGARLGGGKVDNLCGTKTTMTPDRLILQLSHNVRVENDGSVCEGNFQALAEAIGQIAQVAMRERV